MVKTKNHIVTEKKLAFAALLILIVILTFSAGIYNIPNTASSRTNQVTQPISSKSLLPDLNVTQQISDFDLLTNEVLIPPLP